MGSRVGYAICMQLLLDVSIMRNFCVSFACVGAATFGIGIVRPQHNGLCEIILAERDMDWIWICASLLELCLYDSINRKFK